MHVDRGTQEPGGADEVDAARDALHARGAADPEHVSDPAGVAPGIASSRQGEALGEGGAGKR